MDTLEKKGLTASISHTATLLKSGILIYNAEVQDTAGRKTRRRRRTQATAKRYAFHVNTKSEFVKHHTTDIFFF